MSVFLHTLICYSFVLFKQKLLTAAEVSPNHEDLRRLSVELVELLKAQPRCQVMFDKLIPAYRQHFGRQCRVADYGCTKLVELLNSLSSIIQVCYKVVFGYMWCSCWTVFVWFDVTCIPIQMIPFLYKLNQASVANSATPTTTNTLNKEYHYFKVQ